ncbi:MAG TPA: metalloregulator ArsR/SmtB family transcription factor [Nitrospirota bacterium]|nr:metalloregulator ArsR/SmtB family transcription factor [Nitrospirota bacterium]
MVKYSAEALNETFAALADPTRRAILTRLAQGETSTTALAEPFDVSLPAVMKHLRVLEDAGLIIREKEGRVSLCRLNAGPLQHVAEWINAYEQFWRIKLEGLEAHLGRKHERHHP